MLSFIAILMPVSQFYQSKYSLIFSKTAQEHQFIFEPLLVN